MSGTQNVAYYQELNAIVNGRTAPNSIKARIVMTNSSVGNAGQEDKNVIDDYTTQDEMDGTNYVRKQLSGITITKDDTNDRAVMTFDPITWADLGDGTRQMKLVELYADPDGTDDDTQNEPLWRFTGGFPADPGGLDFVWGTGVEIRLP